MKITKSSAKIFASKVLQSTVVFLSTAYFARLLGAEEIGVFFLFQASIGFLGLILDLGTSQALEKRISEGENISQLLTGVLLTKAVLIGFGAIMIFLLRNRVARYFGQDLWVLLVLGLVVHGLYQLIVGGLYGQLRPNKTADIGLIRYLVWAIVGFVGASNGYGSEGLIIGMIIGYATSSLIGFNRLDVSFALPSYATLHSIFEFSRYSFLSRLSSYTFNWIDVLVLGFMATQAAVGAYEVAWRIAAIVNLMGSVVSRVLFPQISKWDSTAQRQRITEVLYDVILISLVIVIPAFVGTLYLAEEILSLVFGKDFSMATVALMIIVGQKIIQAFNQAFGYVITGLNRPELTAMSNGIAAVSNVVLNVLFISYWGVAGAAIATTISFSIALVFNYRFISDLIRVQIPYREIGIVSIASVNMMVVVYALDRGIAIHTVYELVFVVVSAGIAYTAQVLSSTTMREKSVRVVKSLVG